MIRLSGSVRMHILLLLLLLLNDDVISKLRVRMRGTDRIRNFVDGDDREIPTFENVFNEGDGRCARSKR